MAVAAVEFPCEFTSVTVTEAIACELPVMVKGWVNRNWLPKGVEALLPNHAPKSDETGMVRVVVPSVEPGAALNVKIACDKSRVSLKPVITTVNPEALRVAVRLEITGTAGLIRI